MTFLQSIAKLDNVNLHSVGSINIVSLTAKPRYDIDQATQTNGFSSEAAKRSTIIAHLWVLLGLSALVTSHFQLEGMYT